MYTRVHAFTPQFYGFWQMQDVMYPSCRHFPEYFHCPKNPPRPTYSSLPNSQPITAFLTPLKSACHFLANLISLCMAPSERLRSGVQDFFPPSLLLPLHSCSLRCLWFPLPSLFSDDLFYCKLWDSVQAGNLPYVCVERVISRVWNRLSLQTNEWRPPTASPELGRDLLSKVANATLEEVQIGTVFEVKVFAIFFTFS